MDINEAAREWMSHPNGMKMREFAEEKKVAFAQLRSAVGRLAASQVNHSADKILDRSYLLARIGELYIENISLKKKLVENENLMQEAQNSLKPQSEAEKKDVGAFA